MEKSTEEKKRIGRVEDFMNDYMLVMNSSRIPKQSDLLRLVDRINTLRESRRTKKFADDLMQMMSDDLRDMYGLRLSVIVNRNKCRLTHEHDFG